MCNCVAVWQSITARDSKSFTTNVIARSVKMTKVFFPKQVLVWIDENRGQRSRQSFLYDLVLEAIAKAERKQI